MTSYWQVFRLVFVIFFLYLAGDAFYRWDGFRYYASFSEFLPSVALATILWSIVAGLVAMLVWLPARTVEWFCQRMGWKIRIEHLLLFVCVFILLGLLVLLGKQYIWPFFKKGIYQGMSLQLRVIIFLCGTFGAIFLTWLFRNRAERWMSVIHERLTPLVWLFGIITVLSVPLVAYQTWVKNENDIILQENIKPSGADKNQPNIILVTFDALTSRDMSVYGYHRPTTPFINEWAKTASLFTRVEAESHITTPTTASLMTGKRLWTHQTYHLVGASKPVKGYIENLPLELKKNGYYNMAFVVNPHASVRKLGVYGGFDIAPIETGFSKQATVFGRIDTLLYKLFGNKIRLYNWIVQRDFILFEVLMKLTRNFSKTAAPPEKAFNRFLEILNDNFPEPFFVWIHLYPPHDPYLPLEPYMGMFDSSSVLRTYKSQENAVQEASRSHRFKYQQFLPEVQTTVDILRTRYDEFIRYCDKQFEEFIKQLEKRNKLKNTVLILSSDHGESFEHGLIKHSFNNLYEQITHIPLIIWEPAQAKGRSINTLVEQIDIPATILELAGIEVPIWMEGRSLVPLLRGKRLSSRPAFSMALEGQISRGREITKGNIAVWEGDYKLILYIEENKSLLFNLKHDPDEINNLFNREPIIAQRLLNLIQDNLKKANEKISGKK